MMKVTEVRPYLYRISLPQGMRGFQTFIGAWFFDGEYKFLVDVGPKASFEVLMEGLRVLDVTRLDFVFLTHIHIDHAGAAGCLARHFPETQMICHRSGVKHLIDPRKLWEGRKKILGPLALHYGEIDPVPEKNLLASEQFCQSGFRIINTPGHAAHHISLSHGDYLFAGEAGGVFLDLGNTFYLRPATPVKFVLEEAVGSIDRLLEDGGREICYAHSGIHPDAKSMLRRYRNQLYLWKDVVAGQMKQSKGENLLDRCVGALLEEDESLLLLEDLIEEDKERELYFIRNSIQGFIEYLSASQQS
jgi:glyoxylase-like metal-dependent hydrolase (beta-lactamase superfamily II)